MLLLLFFIVFFFVSTLISKCAKKYFKIIRSYGKYVVRYVDFFYETFANAEM